MRAPPPLPPSPPLPTAHRPARPAFPRGGGILAVARYIVNMAGESVSASLRSRAFSSLMLSSTAFHDSASTGELLSRLSADAEALQRVVTTHALNGLRGATARWEAAGAPGWQRLFHALEGV